MKALVTFVENMDTEPETAKAKEKVRARVTVTKEVIGKEEEKEKEDLKEVASRVEDLILLRTVLKVVAKVE